MARHTKNEIRKLLDECIGTLRERGSLIRENKVVTFGNRIYPPYGWCVFLGGGSGSGKGFILKNHYVPISGKKVNVDHWKDLYAKLHGIDYNSHDPEQVSMLHKAVADRHYKQRSTKMLMNPSLHDSRRLPNLIFDMTAKNPDVDLFDKAEEAQDLGYKTMLIWVVATRHEALIRNLERDRTVSDRVFHSIHNEIMRNMPRFLQSASAGECLDDAWIVFSSAPNIDRSDLQGDELKTAVVHLQRGERGFVIDQNTMERLTQYLGKAEENPDNPQTYLSSRDIVSKYGYRKGDGYKIDRSKLDLDKKLYR